MAIKIYKSNNVIAITGLESDNIYISSDDSGMSVRGGQFKIYDRIVGTIYDLGTYDNFQDGDGNTFASTADASTYLTKIINSQQAVDEITGVPIAINFEHHEIHEGDHFVFNDKNTINSGSSITYMLTTTNTTKWVHLMYQIDGSAITGFNIYEGADRVGTTAQSVFNNNRNSTNTAGLIIHKGVSDGTTDGTLIRTYNGGSSSAQSKGYSSTREEVELVLKQNTKYIITITSGTASNLTNISLRWYEHTNKL